MTRRRWSILLASLLSACGEDASQTVPDLAPDLTIHHVNYSGAYTGLVGTTLATPLQVEVRNHGVPAAGIEVSWTGLGGPVTPLVTTTGADGRASASWTLGSRFGQQVVTAKMTAAPERPALFLANATYGPPVAVKLLNGGGPFKSPAGSAGRLYAITIGLVDAEGRIYPQEQFDWDVISGPGAIVNVGTGTWQGDVAPWSMQSLSWPGGPGEAVLRVRHRNTGLTLETTLRFTP